MEKLNDIDQKILAYLAQDARTNDAVIADRVGITPQEVSDRIEQLIQSGIIKHRGYSVDPYALGLHTCTFVGIRLEKGAYYQAVAEKLQEIDEVVECHATTGSYTMMIKLFAIDNRDLMRILNGIIQQIPGVVDTETLISLDRNFDRTFTPRHLGGCAE